MTQNPTTKKYRNIKVDTDTIDSLDKLKIHPRQSYNEVIKKKLLKVK